MLLFENLDIHQFDTIRLREFIHLSLNSLNAFCDGYNNAP